MGFERRAAEIAVFRTNNSSPDEATEWLFNHMNDADFDQLHPDHAAQSPPAAVARQTAGSDGSNAALEAKVSEFVGMLGVTPHQARYSLQRANNDLNAAAEW